MAKYFMRNPHLDRELAQYAVSVDYTPTTYYYGTATFPSHVEDALNRGLVLATPDVIDFQSECGSLYRAETAIGA
jgi:hypothetical protein